MIKIYYFKKNQKLNPEKYLNVLDRVEHQKYLKFKDKSAALNFVLGRKMIKKALSDNLKISENDIKIKIGLYGRPFLEGEDSFDFNLSHCGDYLVLAVCSSGKIGVDIEQEKFIDSAVGKICFSKREMIYLKSGKESFNRLWVLKEAFLKALGTGLAIDMKKISLILPEKNKKINIFTYKKENWYFSEFDIFKNYRLAVFSSSPKIPRKIYELIL